MTATKDWLPTTRDAILAMAANWITVCSARKTDWGISQPALAELITHAGTAEAALDVAKNETTRTPVATARCKEAFDALIACARDFKRRWFLSPPLLDSDYVSLGLHPHDSTHTPGKAPSAQATLETYLIGRHELGLKVVYVSGNPDDPANKGCRIYYRVVAPGETPPTGPEDLSKSFFTKRKKEVLKFDFGDSGKTVYMAVQLENDGKKGEWGPLTSALIP
ncbi:MAG: hypothetical protein LBB68_04760 [Treponema sp.]|jgi:hypothetical protein|nr:hypothetical protein [Treponema sp.]